MYSGNMKLLILYRPESEQATLVETFVRDLQRQHDLGSRLELLSLNTREGASMAALYDIMTYPAILALANDGSVLNIWQGSELPLIDEVLGYTYE